MWWLILLLLMPLPGSRSCLLLNVLEPAIAPRVAPTARVESAQWPGVVGVGVVVGVVIIVVIVVSEPLVTSWVLLLTVGITLPLLVSLRVFAFVPMMVLRPTLFRPTPNYFSIF
jgi:hypothetical protein